MIYRNFLASLFVLVLPLSSTVRAENIQSANHLITALKEAQKKSPSDLEESPAGQLKARIEAFTTTAPTLKPADAAQGWLDLFTAWKEMITDREQSYEALEELGFDSLIAALPPPPAWNALRKLIAALPAEDVLQNQILALLAATLEEDPAGQWKVLEALQKLAAGDFSTSPALNALNESMGGQASMVINVYILELLTPLIQLSDNPDDILKGIEMQISAVAATDDRYQRPLRLPDLVSIAGEAKAEATLKKIISGGLAFEVAGEKTQQLAQKLVLENLSALKTPPWSLVHGLGEQNLAVYEALTKNFPGPKNPNPYAQKSAAAWYFLSLVVAGQTDAADAWLAVPKNTAELNFPYNGLREVEAAGQEARVLDYLLHALEKYPTAPFWRELIVLAAKQGRSAEALTLAKKFAADKNLPEAKRSEILTRLSSAALAAGSVDEGIALLRENLALLKTQKNSETNERLEIALKMAKLGQLLKRSDLIQEGIREALAAKSATAQTTDPELVDLLIKEGRSAEAQDLVLQAMKSELSQNNDSGSFPLDMSRALIQLAGIYDQAGRSNDVLTLLAEAPWWGTKDLSKLSGEVDFRDVPLGVMAARALMANGDQPKAIAVLKETIRENPKLDSAYRLLVEWDGQNSIPFLRTLAASYRFEERPLIWIAYLQLAAGNTQEAEKTIRAAIEIDPSDGEMGKGDRMRAYSVLADILEKQGRMEDVKIYRGAIEAIRLSEDADDYQKAGLLSQAIAMYEKALTYFADAYCIQSRLAVQLADLGDMKQAEEHYLRAYELMPDSFGRMESHCFGCERAFNGEVAETLAEKTFRKMIEENPKKAQTYYLMGYLRNEQNRPADALPFFEKAVAIDPDYINAWQKILGLERRLLLTNQTRNEAIFALLRLQPTLPSSELREATNLKKLWELVEKLRTEFPQEKPAPVFPLEASAEQLKAAEAENPSMVRFLSEPRNQGLRPPGVLLAEQEVIQTISQILRQYLTSVQ